MQSFVVIELIVFFGGAMGFGIWQWLKMRRELRESRAAKEAAKELVDDA